MAYKFREEIVGKRFLSVSGFTKLKVNKISEWGWRAGVIRAASHRDNGCHDLQILVEYDDVEWQRREWLSPHRDAVFSFFLIERGLYWAERPDPRHASLIPIDHHNHANNNHHQHRINGKPLRGATAVADTVAWPALTFYPLVARAELHEDAMPIEFMQDRKLDFVDYSKLKPFTQDWELTKGAMPWGNAVRRWAEMQDGQRILLTTPSVLVGFRVEVYRAEGTTQWYTAVIVGYNESTKDLTVTDDTVLEDHNEDPTLVQMRLIGDGVVESIMRGEVVGMTPRRSRSSTALTHALVVPRPGRRPRRRPGNAAQLQTTPRVQSPISQQLEKGVSLVLPTPLFATRDPKSLWLGARVCRTIQRDVCRAHQPAGLLTMLFCFRPFKCPRPPFLTSRAFPAAKTPLLMMHTHFGRTGLATMQAKTGFGNKSLEMPRGSLPGP
ncbi:JHD2C protein, partial [Acromyrmex insinuator]